MISTRVRTWRRHYLISCQSIPGGNSGHRSGILSLFKEREVLSVINYFEKKKRKKAIGLAPSVRVWYECLSSGHFKLSDKDI